MSDVSRRDFLQSASLLAASSTLFGLEGLVARAASANTERSLVDVTGGYGPLRPTLSQNTGEYVLALPEGFSYTVFGRAGDRLADGNLCPTNHDGMAAFAAPNGKIRLVRNHEIKGKPGDRSAIANAYDAKAPGGCTTLIVDPKTRQLEKDFLSLAGTSTNCAGGPTPWGSWISCEETTVGTKAGFDKEHGYCFEVASRADGTPSNPVPLKAMGRFVHEAVAIDPRTGIVYLTEDRGTAGFYRFLPKVKGKLAEGGRLQVALVKGRKNFDTRSGQTLGATYTLTWVDIEDPDPKNAESEALAVYNEGQAKGAATFARLEGAWYGRGSIFINATDGGNKKMGQVWQYTPQDSNEGKLVLLFESPDASVLAMPDNICVSPRGGLVICEDSGESNQSVRGLTPKGEIFDFARNILPGFESQEFAGSCFSPDGKTLFFNIQTPGITCAVWGPWERGAL